ncbi:acyl-[acyl-carrier-protein] thioesterase [Mangrovibacterium diazotrophicum]|uniref:Acyl-ACP thioesterase n=1 Tax=Mangrovibacterium diazotrophicum TaxID=1261403 RepID=A0A419VWA2_9BACT|nr:acyl-ACP thioesterase domain-containing protein [Mangrovibacterium diazotrophicum]RKD86437.1 acyl-ACP thioesterase [Mangrovibacterium diazotrophicum]
MNRHTETIQINSYQTNHFAEATIPSVMNFLLEAAWAHAQKLEWGYDLLQKNHMFWVLSRFYVEIKQLPKWQQQVKLNTWSAGTDGMYAYREFVLQNEEGETILTANSAWLILNTETKKIVLLRDHKETFPRFNGEGVCREPKRLRFKKSDAELQFNPVVYSDIDVNHHFNSVKALERVLDEYGINFQDEFEPASVEINYLKEGLPGDNLAVTRNAVGDNKFQSAIIRESDSAELSTFEIEWRKKATTF